MSLFRKDMQLPKLHCLFKNIVSNEVILWFWFFESKSIIFFFSSNKRLSVLFVGFFINKVGDSIYFGQLFLTFLWK